MGIPAGTEVGGSGKALEAIGTLFTIESESFFQGFHQHGIHGHAASPEIARSVSLAADDLGLMGKLDLVSCDLEGGEAIPIETKRGRGPNAVSIAQPLRIHCIAPASPCR